MYIHLPLLSSSFWGNVLALCVVLLSEVSRNTSGILPIARSENRGKCWFHEQNQKNSIKLVSLQRSHTFFMPLSPSSQSKFI